MRWAFRIATGVKSGAGHVARCASIAQVMDATITVFTDPDATNFQSTSRVYDGIETEARPDSADELLSACRAERYDAVLIDNYAISDSIVAHLTQGTFTAVFRDSAVGGAESISVSIRPAAVDGSNVIGGLRYAPLAGYYAELGTRAAVGHPKPVSPVRILVSFGQRDSANRTASALRALALVDCPCHVTVVLGAEALHLEEIRMMTAELNSAELAIAPPHIEELYLRHDIAIGAPGVSQMERVCCGLPTILIPQNNAQMPLAEEWASEGMALCVPPIFEEIAKAVLRLIEDPAEAERIRHNGITAIDGRGAERLAGKLLDHAARAHQ
jgi:spore coat polysaccharide biosynthesis predicted glycosyltransferase SpsG